VTEYGEGVFRRRILLQREGERAVTADVEDDFHRFGLRLLHDGERVVAVEGRALRYPWATCPGAVEPLKALAGMPLGPRSTDVGRHAAAHDNCTHLFDLAGLAVAHAASGRAARRYDVAIPDRDEAGRTTARIFRDGELVLTWDLEWMTVQAPLLFEGVALRGGFIKWAETHLDPETAEAAMVLRRCAEISFGRQTPWDELEVAADVGDFMIGLCHTFQPGTADVALRVKGTVRDFTGSPDALLA